MQRDAGKRVELLVGAIALAAILLAFWIHGHVLDFWARVRQAFAVVQRPALYFRTVAFWQACDWLLRLVTIWFMLGAFGIPQTVENALLVQVSASVATLVPLTPAGIGTEQAFLLYVFRGTVSNAEGRERRNELQQAACDAYADAPRTSSRAFARAQSGLQNNEEMTFTSREIDLFLPEALRLGDGEA